MQDLLWAGARGLDQFLVSGGLYGPFLADMMNETQVIYGQSTDI